MRSTARSRSVSSGVEFRRWEWGDGRSEHQEDCEPWTPGTKVRTVYERRHVYRDPGEYEVLFALGQRVLARETLQALPRAGGVE